MRLLLAVLMMVVLAPVASAAPAGPPTAKCEFIPTPENPAARPVQPPPAVVPARGTVKVGSFPRDDTHLVILTLAPGEWLHVLVIPSDHEPQLADDLLARVPEHLGRDAHLLLGCRTR